MTTRVIDTQYDTIRRDLLAMGGVVEEMIDMAGQALATRDGELAREVMRTDSRVDQLEKQIDEHCHEILARQQPMAVDLRLLLAVMKITTDLERIGDLSNNIGRSVRDLVRGGQVPDDTEIRDLFAGVRRMVAGALDAFMRRDAEMAMEIWQRDAKIDERYRAFFDHLVARSAEAPEDVGPFFQLLLIGRALERIADHATNIAEDVIYYVQGVDIRHTGKKTEESAEESAEA
ncbi:MAG: phosphate signaling complex protein PhoU [Thermoanaerobaculia bacterium]